MNLKNNFENKQNGCTASPFLNILRQSMRNSQLHTVENLEPTKDGHSHH